MLFVTSGLAADSALEGIVKDAKGIKQNMPYVKPPLSDEEKELHAHLFKVAGMGCPTDLTKLTLSLQQSEVMKNRTEAFPSGRSGERGTPWMSAMVSAAPNSEAVHNTGSRIDLILLRGITFLLSYTPILTALR